PVIGFHSVIDSPLSVSRVTPPTATIRTTNAATTNSQRASERGPDRPAVGRACCCATEAMQVPLRRPPAECKGGAHGPHARARFANFRRHKNGAGASLSCATLYSYIDGPVMSLTFPRIR